jgi:hypothetical protein
MTTGPVICCCNRGRWAWALLAEQILGGVIRLDLNGTLAAGRGRPADELGRRVASLVAGEQPLPVQDWLLYPGGR